MRLSVLLGLFVLLFAVRLPAQEVPAPTPPEELQPLVRLRLVVPEKGKEPALKAWRRFAVALGKHVGLPVTFTAVNHSTEASAMLVKGEADFAVLEPVDYVRVAELTERGAIVALADTARHFGFQAALLVRADSEHATDTDVLSSDEGIGVLRMGGIQGRFYYGPITDDQWLVHEDLKPRLVYGRSAEQLLEWLRRQTGKPRLGAVLLPVSELSEPDAEGLRDGLREVWLSPFCPGRVIAARSKLGKRERLRIGEACLALAQGGHLAPAGVGGLRLIEDAAFEPLRAFVPGARDSDQSR